MTRSVVPRRALVRWMIPVYALMAAAMLPWVVYLAWTLPGAQRRGPLPARLGRLRPAALRRPRPHRVPGLAAFALRRQRRQRHRRAARRRRLVRRDDVAGRRRPHALGGPRAAGRAAAGRALAPARRPRPDRDRPHGRRPAAPPGAPLDGRRHARRPGGGRRRQAGRQPLAGGRRRRSTSRPPDRGGGPARSQRRSRWRPTRGAARPRPPRDAPPKDRRDISPERTTAFRWQRSERPE